MLSCRRITFLSCCQIQRPPPAIEERRLDSSPLRFEAKSKRKAHDEEDEAIFNVWAPLSTDTHSQKHKRPKRSREDSADSIWLCPEVDRRTRTDNARRLKALRVAERMDVMVQAARKRDMEDAKDEDAKERSGCGAKRKKPDRDASNRVNGDVVPRSLETVTPQSLLIPELLPREMLRTPQSARKQHPALLSSSPVPQEKATEPEASARVVHDKELDLGLDLGLSVSRRTAATHRGPQFLLGTAGPTSLGLDIAAAGTPTDTQTEDDVMASILEITSFLERDVDVFTPLSATTRTASTPRSSAFADPLSSPALSKPKIDASKYTTTNTPPGDC